MESRKESTTRPDYNDAGRNNSWGAIIGGVFTFLALLIMFSLLGSAIGFGVTDLTSDQPFDNVGTGLIIWVIASLLLSLGAAGFVAGAMAGRAGLIHGFLTWATSIVLLFGVLSFTTANVLQGVGSVLGSVGNAAAQGVSSAASSAQDTIEDTFDSITDELSGIDTDEIEANVEEILEDTEIPELQPEYLEDQLAQSRDDILDAANEVVVNPENFESVVDDLATTLTNRAEEIEEAADEEAIENAVANNTDLSEDEVDEITSNIATAVENISVDLNNAEAALNEAATELESTIEDLRVEAEEATNTAATASIWGFAALLLTLIGTAFAGFGGTKVARKFE
ncbi:TIGR04086 family membrane protein [Shouchella sp. JSM 1781072]|uniref:TIGR04086 family membrane protein n=1 Tax=Shouchella sp. JSM 1781072 TaxID=3344581 RepID=UPI0035C1A690